MAEILGVVCGVITVGQFGASIVKLRKLWDEIKNVPESINALMMELELLDSLLSEMDLQFPRTQAITHTDRLALLSLERCREAKQILDQLVNDLQSQISSARRLKRGLGSVKVTLKKNLIHSYHERLQRSLQLLALSQRVHQTALLKSQPSLILSGVQNILTGVRKELSSLESTPTSDSPCVNASTYEIVVSNPRESCFEANIFPWRRDKWLWSFDYERSEISRSRDETENVYRARIQLHFLRRAWDFQARKSYSGWKVFIKPWSIRSPDSKVFDYASEGSTEDLLRLIRSGNASPYDRDLNGFTLLHYAAFFGHLEMLRKLVEMGLSVLEADTEGDTPLYWLCYANHDARNALDLYRYLSSLGALDEVVRDLFSLHCREPRQTTLYQFVWKSAEVLDFVITQFCPNFYQLPARDCFGSLDWLYVDPKVLLQILTTRKIVKQAHFLGPMHDNREHSLQRFSSVYFQECLDNLEDNGTIAEDGGFGHWRRLLRWMFVGANIDDVCQVGDQWWNDVSPLFKGLLSCRPVPRGRLLQPRHVRSRLSTALKMWLEDLSVAGLDLMRYGVQEWHLYSQDEWLQTRRWHSLTKPYRAWDESGPHLASFTYGPKPEDWALHWDLEVEEFVGDFWQLFEAPPSREPRMPGAWEED